jgi:hypothetical protein
MSYFALGHILDSFIAHTPIYGQHASSI